MESFLVRNAMMAHMSSNNYMKLLTTLIGICISALATSQQYMITSIVFLFWSIRNGLLNSESVECINLIETLYRSKNLSSLARSTNRKTFQILAWAQGWIESASLCNLFLDNSLRIDKHKCDKMVLAILYSISKKYINRKK